MNKISLEIALEFTEKFQAQYPKRDLHELTEELANRIEKAIQVQAGVIVNFAEEDVIRKEASDYACTKVPKLEDSGDIFDRHSEYVDYIFNNYNLIKKC